MQIVTYVSQAYADKPITFGTRVFRVTPDSPSLPIFGEDLTVDVTWQYDFLLLPNFTEWCAIQSPDPSSKNGDEI